MPTPLSSYSEQDFQAWLKWKQEPSDTTHSALLHRFDPLINKEVNKWQSGTMPLTLMKTEAYKIVSDAVKAYNPNAGAKLSTYIVSQLQKLKRFGYRNQNVLYIPESRTIKVQTYKNAVQHLVDVLGRPPSTSETADYLRWSTAEVARMENELRSDYIAEQGVSSNQILNVKPTDFKIQYVYNDLNPREQVVFEHITGMNGKKELGVPDIAKKLKTTPNEIYRIKESIAKKLRSLL
jgi:DNA-directed RNA polymerase specialized sigma subunit